MSSQTSRSRVVIIGGGIAGCSVAYHLAELGVSECVLLEKAELTSGSTWHAAGLCTQFNSSRPLTKLLMRSLDLYERLGAAGEAGDLGLRRVGSIRLALTSDALDEFRTRQATAKTLDLPFELIDRSRVRQLWPLLNLDGVLGAAHLPTDGYVDPSMATQALAAGARERGVEIRRRTPVTGLRQSGDGWLVDAGESTIECERVVIAAGQWTRKVGELAGVRLPVVPLQHQYAITEPLPAVGELDGELPVLRDPRASFYSRQEAGGLMVGPFESSPLMWNIHSVPDDFEARLLPGNLDQIMDVMLAASHRIPVLEDAGIKYLLNGPDGYTPDGRCLMGPIPGHRGLFVLAGFSIFGIAYAGGAGLYAAEWIVDGRPSDDLWELDVTRFGDFAQTASYVSRRAQEIYEREYAIHYPGEELEAGRPLKTGPLYDRLAKRGAVFGERSGWERPLWFAREGEPREEYSFRRPSWHEAVAYEACAVRNAVGVLDQTSFAKYELAGRGSRQALDPLCANRLPEPGRIALTQMLAPDGGVVCDVTVTCVDEDHFYLISAAAAEQHDLAWIEGNLPSSRSIRLENVTPRQGVLTIAGPRSRELLQRLCPADISRRAFPFFHARELDVGAVPCRVLRLSYVGELGFELHHPVEYSRALYASLLEAGGGLDLVDFGYRTLDSMRLEKGYRLWGADLTPDFNPLEAGFERLIDWSKSFIGKQALLSASPPSRHLRTLHYESDEQLEAPVYAPVYGGGRHISWILASGWGHTVDRGICLAYLPTRYASENTTLEVEILGHRTPVTVTDRSLYDPENAQLRS